MLGENLRPHHRRTTAAAPRSIGADAVAKSAPDGQSLPGWHVGTHAINPRFTPICP
jgi:hypothetical protein